MPRSVSTTVHQRFECIDPERNHRKFYELSVEMLLFGPTLERPSEIVDGRGLEGNKNLDAFLDMKIDQRGLGDE